MKTERKPRTCSEKYCGKHGRSNYQKHTS